MGGRIATALASLIFASLASCGSQGVNPNDGLTTTMSDGGDPPPTPFNDPFAGAPAFSSKGGGGTFTEHPNGDPTGKACGGSNNVGCHSSAQNSGDQGPALVVGGTVYQGYTVDGGTPVPAAGVEVRVLDANNNTASAYSNANGTFYILARNTSAALPAWVGVRDANTQRPMITQLTGNMWNCSQASCHVGIENGGYYLVHIP